MNSNREGVKTHLSCWLSQDVQWTDVSKQSPLGTGTQSSPILVFFRRTTFQSSGWQKNLSTISSGDPPVSSQCRDTVICLKHSLERWHRKDKKTNKQMAIDCYTWLSNWLPRYNCRNDRTILTVPSLWFKSFLLEEHSLMDPGILQPSETNPGWNNVLRALCRGAENLGCHATKSEVFLECPPLSQSQPVLYIHVLTSYVRTDSWTSCQCMDGGWQL